MQRLPLYLVCVLLGSLSLGACDGPVDRASARPGTSQPETAVPQSAAMTGAVTSSGLSDLQRSFSGTVGDSVYFETDRWDLSAADQVTMQRQAAWLGQHPQLAIVVAGHGDERGTREYNLALGERRAATVQQFLQALGLDARRVAVISYGKEKPDCVAGMEACWAQNRRAVTMLENQ